MKKWKGKSFSSAVPLGPGGWWEMFDSEQSYADIFVYCVLGMRYFEHIN